MFLPQTHLSHSNGSHRQTVAYENANQIESVSTIITTIFYLIEYNPIEMHNLNSRLLNRMTQKHTTKSK